jgi:hypothetical protein
VSAGDAGFPWKSGIRTFLARVFAVLLILEGLSSALRATTRLSAVMVYPWVTVVFMALRLAVAVQQFSSGWMVMGRRRPGPALARWTYAASAVLVTLELGFRFAPTNLFPAYRWWAVGLYWAYALTGIWVFRRGTED